MNFHEYALTDERSSDDTYESHENVMNLVHARNGITELTVVATQFCVFVAPLNIYRTIPLMREVAKIHDLSELEDRGICISGTVTGEVLLQFEEVMESSITGREECITRFPSIILGRLRKSRIGNLRITFWNHPDTIKPSVKEQVRNMLIASGEDPRDVIMESSDCISSFREWCRIPASQRGCVSKYNHAIQRILPRTVY